jgi:hypothetical protein
LEHDGGSLRKRHPISEVRAVPIRYEIDHARRLVSASAYGVFTSDDAFAYQRDVWSRPEVEGYDELFDMTAVEQVIDGTASRVKELAELAARMDRPDTSSRFAIVAPRDFEFALGRMFTTYRELSEGSRRHVEVFRSSPEALRWIVSGRTGEGSPGGA